MSDIRIEIDATAARYERVINDAIRRAGGLETALKQASSANFQRVEQQLDGVNRSLNGLGAGIVKLGSAVTIVRAIGDAATATADKVRGLIKSASDLTESINKADVVFGNAASGIQEFAKQGPGALGLSRQAALEATATFGNLFTAMGIGNGRAADMSKELTGLAADLASFNNISVDDALVKLRAGLVGEVEPLRTVGVNLSEMTIEAKAMQLGILKTGEVLTAAGKAQAAYALIFEQTRAAQGDFGRTSNELANGVRILQGRFSDLAAEIGSSFQPLARDAVGIINGLLDSFKSTGTLDAFKGALASGAEGVRLFIDDVKRLTSDDGLNILDATLATVASRVRSSFGEDAGRGFEILTGTVGDLSSALGTFVDTRVIPAVQQLQNLNTALLDAAVNGKPFEEAIGPAGKALDGLRGALEFIDTHKEVLVGFLAALVAFQAISIVIPLVTGLATAFSALFAAFAVGGTGAGIGAIVALLGGPLVLAIGGVSVALGLLVTAWAGNWGDIQTKTYVAVTFISGKLQDLGKAADALPGLIGEKFSEIGTSIRASLPTISAAVDEVRTAIAGVFRREDAGQGLDTSAQQRALDELQQKLNQLDPSNTQEAISLITKAWDKLPEEAQDAYRKYAVQLQAVANATNDAEFRGTRSFNGLLAAIRDFSAGTHGYVDATVADLKRIGDEVQNQQRVATQAAAAAKVAAENQAAINSLTKLGNFGGEGPPPETTTGSGNQGSQSGGQTSTPNPNAVTRHQKTAIEGFMEALSKDLPRWERAFGEAGGRMATTFVDAFDNNSDAAGSALGKSVQDMAQALEKAGVPNFQQLADELAGSFHTAFIAGTEATKQAALQKIGEIVEILRQATALSADSFARTFATAQGATLVGNNGAQALEALDTAVKEGGSKSIEALAKAVEGMRVALFNDKDLSPEEARGFWDRIFAAWQDAIADGGAETRATLEQMIATINIDSAALKIGNQLEQQLKDAADAFNETVAQAARTAAEQIQQATDNLAESRALRGARENVDRTQADELDNVIKMIDKAREAWHDYRESQRVERSRAREDEDIDRRRAQEDADIAAKLKNRTGVTGQLGRGLPEEIRKAYEAAGQVIGRSPMDDEQRKVRDEAKRLQESRNREDAERIRRRAQEDADLAQSRADRAEDQQQETNFLKIVDTFKRQQATNLQTFLDQQADEALGRQVDRINRQQADTVAKAEETQIKTEARAIQAAQRELERLQLINDVRSGAIDISEAQARLAEQMADVEGRRLANAEALARIQQRNTGTTQPPAVDTSTLEGIDKANKKPPPPTPKVPNLPVPKQVPLTIEDLKNLPEHEINKAFGREEAPPVENRAAPFGGPQTPGNAADLLKLFGGGAGTAGTGAPPATARTGGNVIQDVHVHIDLHGTNAIGIPGGLDELARLLGPKIEQVIKSNVRVGG